MGFFANRWIEKHGAETEKAALSSPQATPLPKTKWVLEFPLFPAVYRTADASDESAVFAEEGQ